MRSVGAARENARSIREVISLEAWEAVNQLYHWLGSDAARGEWDEHRWEFYKHLRDGARLCLGLLEATMLHDTPLDFIQLGALLERACRPRACAIHHHGNRCGGDHTSSRTRSCVLAQRCRGTRRHEAAPRARDRREGGRFLCSSPIPRWCATHHGRARAAGADPPRRSTRSLAPSRKSTWRAIDAWIASREGAVDAARIRAPAEVVDESHEICDEIGRDLLGHIAG